MVLALFNFRILYVCIRFCISVHVSVYRFLTALRLEETATWTGNIPYFVEIFDFRLLRIILTLYRLTVIVCTSSFNVKYDDMSAEISSLIIFYLFH
jgi:hypothetical protein